MLIQSLYLSQWFAGKNKKVILSGTSFLFLTQISFILVSLYLVIIKLCALNIAPKMSALFVVVCVSFIMFGFRNYIERKIIKKGLLNTLYFKKHHHFKYRIFPLTIFVLSYLSVFVVAIIFYR